MLEICTQGFSNCPICFANFTYFQLFHSLESQWKDLIFLIWKLCQTCLVRNAIRGSQLPQFTFNRKYNNFLGNYTQLPWDLEKIHWSPKVWHNYTGLPYCCNSRYTYSIFISNLLLVWMVKWCLSLRRHTICISSDCFSLAKKRGPSNHVLTCGVYCISVP